MKLGKVASGLVASKLRIALIAVLALGVVVGGTFAAGVLGIPGIATIDNTFGEVTEETTTIETDIVISNPNPFGIGTDDVTVNYTISMNGIEMAHGDREGVDVGTGNSTLELETQLLNDAIPPWWTSHVQNDEVTEVTVDATVTSERLGRSTDISQGHEIQTDLIGAFNSDETRPVNADSPLTDDPVLYINETHADWGSVTDDETPMGMEFVVFNPNLEPYAMTELGYEITMNDVHMGEGETHQEHIIPSYSSGTVPLTTTLQNQHLDDWWVTHLDEDIHGHQVSELRIEFYAVVEFPTGDEVIVPLDELTYEETIETDIFDEGEGVRDSDGVNGDSGDDESADGTEDDGTGDDITDDGTDDDSADDDGTGDDSADDGDETDDDGTDDDGDEDADTGDDDDDGILPLPTR